ncbi:hypothetical protein ANCCAN_05304 [Ancylostoma caninum]|uniref:Knottin scorpion toxin-like domain-containing protein n=1 Tax=Ancylostoma caninum TaxID=29170 RepID=A0A368H060_ANCCA|nr:hypothetical protein ANCCAN_05304 [Ancylostoma caninum]
MKYLPIFALLIIVLDFALLTVARGRLPFNRIRMSNICAEKNGFLPKKAHEQCQSACEELKCMKGACFKARGTDVKTCKCFKCVVLNNPKDKKPPR